jgi:tRNA threonylcarbamoyladenosine biosynthesis protein TsaE
VPSTDDTDFSKQLSNYEGTPSAFLVSRSLADTALFADELARVLLPGDVVLLIGDLGAGKTAFTKSLARSLAIDEPITSPTFTIMRTYDGSLPGGTTVVLAHLDAYRLEHADAIEDLGLFELLDRGAVAVIEWGDLVAEAFDTAPLVIRITTGSSAPPAGSTEQAPAAVDPGGDVLDADGEFEDRAPRHILCSAHPEGPWQARLAVLSGRLPSLMDQETSS